MASFSCHRHWASWTLALIHQELMKSGPIVGFSNRYYVKSAQQKDRLEQRALTGVTALGWITAIRSSVMTDQKNDHNNDKSQQNQPGKDQHQPKTGQQANQQQGQHGHQAKSGEAPANADSKPNQENKSKVNNDNNPGNNKR
jgi:hypothetical protein